MDIGSWDLTLSMIAIFFYLIAKQMILRVGGVEAANVRSSNMLFSVIYPNHFDLC